MVKSLLRQRISFSIPFMRAVVTAIQSTPPARLGTITTDLLKTFAPEKLTSTCYMIFPFKAVPCRIVTAVLSKWSSGNAKLWIFGKFPHQEAQVIGIEGKIRIQISDDIKLIELQLAPGRR